MGGIAVAVARDREDVTADARTLASTADYRRESGTREVRAGAATAIYLAGSGERDRIRSMPALSADRSVLLVADARLDNRRELARAIGLDRTVSADDDGLLLLRSYERWGETFGEHLVGDFCVALWDAARRRFVAARDARAMRPLHYRVEPARILAASDVSQVLAVAGVPRDPDGERMAVGLVGATREPDWTFYAGVQRLPPGQTLVVDDGGVRVRPFAVTVARDEPPHALDDYADELRTRLAEAVRCRMDGEAPGLLLSGGLDSLCIAGTAGLLHRQASGVALLRTYSFAYDTLPQCDERDVSGVVTAHYSLPSRSVPADDAWPLAEHPKHGPDLDAPDRFRSHVIMGRAVDAARRDGVTVLMTGQHGDPLVGGPVIDHLGRLLESGPLALWRDVTAHGRQIGRSRLAILNRHILWRLLVTAWPRGRAPGGRRRLRALIGRPDRTFAPWLRPEMIRRFHLRERVERAIPAAPLRGEASRRRYAHIANPALGHNTEALERKFARAGVRYADPWSDARLVELVLRMPQYLVTPAGEPKGWVRRAMQGVLPEPARFAAAKRSPGDAYTRGLGEKASGVILSLIDGSRLAARGYVDEAALRSAYEQAMAAPHLVSERQWSAFWRFIDVEDWLRRFHDR